LQADSGMRPHNAIGVGRIRARDYKRKGGNNMRPSLQ
jgi:hypothetical protein